MRGGLICGCGNLTLFKRNFIKNDSFPVSKLKLLSFFYLKSFDMIFG